MVSVGDTIDRVLRKYQERDTPDVLVVSMDSTQETLQYQGFLPAWGPGHTVSIDQERMIVTAVDRDNQVATVVRGWDDTTPASHSTGARITLGPRGNRAEVLELINDCLADLYPDLFRVKSVDLTYEGGTIGYGIPFDAIRILRVTARLEESSDLWEPVHDWYIEDTIPQIDFSDKAIMLRVSLPSGSIFNVKYGAPFDVMTDESQILEFDAGLETYMTDLPYYYALSRILIGDEQKRATSGSAVNHQRAGDIPPFIAMRTGEWYYARYLERKQMAIKTQAFDHRESIGTGYGS